MIVPELTFAIERIVRSFSNVRSVWCDGDGVIYLRDTFGYTFKVTIEAVKPIAEAAK